MIHRTPLDTACEDEDAPVPGEGPCGFETTGERPGWKQSSFDDSTWNDATTHSARDVDPKQGYDGIVWDSRAELIWAPDLQTDNTVLCRVTVARGGR